MPVKGKKKYNMQNGNVQCMSTDSFMYSLYSAFFVNTHVFFHIHVHMHIMNIHVYISICHIYLYMHMHINFYYSIHMHVHKNERESFGEFPRSTYHSTVSTIHVNLVPKNHEWKVIRI